ncbi:periplasmic nitrate reductase chaperone NapD [Ferrimonas sediminum]|uniref:Chaperone NapD n=1 Tax=Ferrimonas sediminum TaxID=718193 RepID=A0A1G8T252_9GAMM|nr:chaperone NapD [Ferrimonas sediminum]SDJ35516.1 periplasmic nitrate reductase chaperone NapD [Ferrimonas sediminum]
MSQEYHVVSLAVHANPTHQQQLQQQIAEVAGAELVATTDDHKLVVTLEGDSRQAVLNGIETINQLQGVISSALAYHQVEQFEDKDTA